MKQKLHTACFALLTSVVINAQIMKVKEINDNLSLSSSPTNLTVFNNKIYFSADDSSGSNSPGGDDLGRELWVTDGTESGTTFVKDLRTGSDNSSPSNFFEFNNTLYFSANTGSGNVLFTTDGTDTGTTQTAFPFIFNQTELNGKVYFVLTSDSYKLYQFDGSNAIPVTNSGTGVEAVIGATIASFKNKIYCYMDYSEDEASIGRELYAYDPTSENFTLIKDITEDDTNSGISNFTILGDELYFEAEDTLWKTDGTESGTMAVTETTSLAGITSLFAWNGILFFEGDNGTSEDQLWSYNPSNGVLTNVSNLNGSSDVDGDNHDPSDYAGYGAYLYYAGKVSDNSSKYLFRTDGVTTTRLDSNIIDIDDLVVLNGVVYFEGDNGTTGNELYSLDTTTLSANDVTQEIVQVFPNPATNFVKLPDNFKNSEFTIYDSNGKMVRKGLISSNEIKFDLCSGLYLLKIKTEFSILTRKILVK
ncbi:T9SS type A sorting domain-containing protein [Aestuariibaculum suncheonense]|uniref:T9SS type A sorting domain-containing protein n=1 Tax=Aestuariibaculum suncheonense TaxID=1028745 RepID=A0A8J6Q3R6_9FLAO|nr:T9SS type A sorting domain-containing protein [Aestuariibaculum suncheonense]MBD0834593.1 T9SS type A sorting domain-containing protein [Aestuariibaculum suncheonense]